MEDTALPPTPSAATRSLIGTAFNVHVTPLREGGGHSLSVLNTYTGAAYLTVAPFPDPVVAARASARPEDRHEACLAGMHAWAAHVLPRVAPGRLSFVARPSQPDADLRSPEVPLAPLGTVILPILFRHLAVWPHGGRIRWSLQFAQPGRSLASATISLYAPEGRFLMKLPPEHALSKELVAGAERWWPHASVWFAGADRVEIADTLAAPTAHQRMAALRASADLTAP